MFPNPERGYDDDKSVTLGRAEGRDDIVIIRAVSGSGPRDGGPDIIKYVCVSFVGERVVVTAHLNYDFDGGVSVGPWKKELEGKLLVGVDMEHVRNFGSRESDRVVERHLDRLDGRRGEVEGLRDKAEQLYFDMLWNVPQW